MKISKIVLPLMMAGMLSQTGCIIGAATGNIPLAIIGGAVAVGGAAYPFLASEGGNSDAAAFEFLFNSMGGGLVMIGGIILNADDPGRQVALNPIPLDEKNATVLGVSTDDLETYNYEDLTGVLETNTVIENAIADVTQKKVTLEAALEKLAPELGLKKGDELMNVIKGNNLGASEVKAFAHARGIAETSAKIYLKTRWAVEVK